MTEEFTVELSTQRKNILLLSVKDNEIQGKDGVIFFANFSIERLFDGSDDFFGYSGIYVSAVKKTEHAWVSYDEHHGGEIKTFLDFSELKTLDRLSSGQPLYVIPLTGGFNSVVIREIGSNKVESWFRSEDPFMAVFNGLHEFCGNNPEKFIF